MKTVIMLSIVVCGMFAFPKDVVLLPKDKVLLSNADKKEEPVGLKDNQAAKQFVRLVTCCNVTRRTSFGVDR